MSDCGVCLSGCDGEYADVWNVSTRLARKQHKCCECGDVIPSGSRYQIISMLYEGSWGQYKTCSCCAEIRTAFSCDGETVEALWDDMREYVFSQLTTSCFDKLMTPEAKAFLRHRWMVWKGLAA